MNISALTSALARGCNITKTRTAVVASQANTQSQSQSCQMMDTTTSATATTDNSTPASTSTTRIFNRAMSSVTWKNNVDSQIRSLQNPLSSAVRSAIPSTIFSGVGVGIITPLSSSPSASASSASSSSSSSPSSSSYSTLPSSRSRSGGNIGGNMGGFGVTINTQRSQRRGMASKKHKRIIKMAKGYRGRSKNTFRAAVRRVEKGLQYAYRDRKTKKRNFRKLWIERINAGVRQHGMSYSKFINAMANMGIMSEADLRNVIESGTSNGNDVGDGDREEDKFDDIDEREEMDKMPPVQEGQMILNRKMLADLAANEPFSFKAVVDVVKMQSASGGK